MAVTPAPPVSPPPTPSPTPSAPKLSLVSRAYAAVAWFFTPDGRKDAGAAVAAVTAIYVALHRAGVL